MRHFFPSLNNDEAAMLKLNIECFENLFELLSLSDLLVLRQTCRRLKQVIDYFIHEYYPAVQLTFGKLTIDEHTLKELRKTKTGSLKSLKEIRLWTDESNKRQISVIKNVAHQLENLHLHVSPIHNFDQFHIHYFKNIVEWCPNLKTLCIYKIEKLKLSEELLFLSGRHPTLKHIVLNDREYNSYNSYDGFESDHPPELKQFFEQNPNIQILSTTFHYLLKTRNSWLRSNIKLDRLDIAVDTHADEHSREEMNLINACGFFNRLYREGFYKRIHIYTEFTVNQNDMNHIASVKGLEKLYAKSEQIETLPPLPDLKELCIGYSVNRDLDRIDRITSNLMNVERIHFHTITSNEMMSFIRHAANVREIKISALKGGIYFENNIVDVSQLNKEREKLMNACKVTIYIQENAFLATKWAGKKTIYPIVELKRSQAIDWQPEIWTFL